MPGNLHARFLGGVSYPVVGEVDFLGNTLFNTGIISYKKSDFVKAEKFFRECIDLGETRNSLYSLMLGYSGLTKVAAARKNIALAEQYADSTLFLEESIGYPEAKIDIYTDLFNLYKNLNNSYKALNYHLLLTELEDSLFNVEKNKQIEELNTLYGTEKKEQEIVLLKQQQEQEQTRKMLWLAIFILTILLALFIIYSITVKSRKRLALLEKEKEVDRLKSQLFTNISHEFRTPLTLIKGPLEKLQKEETSPKKKKVFKLMQKHTSQLLNMINQILDLAKIEAGKLQLHYKKHEVLELLRRWTMSFQSYADTKNQKLVFSTRADFVEFETDSAALETIVNNLVSNAVKYEPENGRIDVTCDIVESDKTKKLIVEVKNYGSYIIPDELQKIFDRYYRADEPHQQQQSVTGTGIGLALSKELITLLQGDIKATSTPEKGTTFSIEIPLPNDATIIQQYSADDINTMHGKSAISAEDQANMKGMQEWMTQAKQNENNLVLVVEDNEDVREFIQGTLQEEGYRVITAPNGQTGIDMALKTIPDLVVSDVMMPIKDGYEVCQALKQDEKTSHVPLILLTAKASFESKMKGLDIFADDYLVKPFSTTELLTRIRNLIILRKKLRDKFTGFLPSTAAERPKSLDESFLHKIRTAVEKNIENEFFGVEELAVEIGMSRSQLHRKLSAITGITPNQFIRNYRLEKAMELIKTNSSTVAEVAFSVGFSSAAYFGKCFREYFKTSPGEVRNTIN